MTPIITLLPKIIIKYHISLPSIIYSFVFGRSCRIFCDFFLSHDFEILWGKVPTKITLKLRICTSNHMATGEITD